MTLPAALPDEHPAWNNPAVYYTPPPCPPPIAAPRQPLEMACPACAGPAVWYWAYASQGGATTYSIDCGACGAVPVGASLTAGVIVT